ncbi:MFS transporter [Filimonas lacunae]|uniref:MFS transporter n=1 Tax=Filimonas lacunae TaxID=477680 RepID=UPI001E64FB84|nr:MFS transporter [Filimonas lacunae]
MNFLNSGGVMRFNFAVLFKQGIMLQSASEKRKKIATILAFISIPLSGFVTDIYLPSFPDMAKSLEVAEKNIQLTLTCFFLSYGISQLFVGSLLDSIGRFKPAMYALVALVLSSMVIGLTRDVRLICLLRVLQGIAVAFVVVGKRAFFVDLYTGDKLKHYLSFFTITWSLGPIVAPFLGGFLQKLFGWQSNFYFLAIYALLMLVFELIYSGETLATRKPFHITTIKKNYAMMLGNPVFLLGIITLGLAYSVVMVFNISGPFVIANSFHFSSVVIGYCTLMLGFSWMIGGIVAKRLIALEFNKKVMGAAMLQLALIVVLLAISVYSQQLWCFMLFAFIIHICSGFLYTVNFTTSLLFFPQHAGMTSGLMGGLVYLITSLASYVISITGKIATQEDIVWRYICISVLLVGTVGMAIYKKKEKYLVAK